MFIYKITNKINGKSYIGQTIRKPEERWKQHSYRTESIIGNALEKYGMENFEFRTLLKCDSLEELNNQEIEMINLFNTLTPNGYNIAFGGNNKKMREETKKKIGLIHKNKIISEEHKKILSITHKDKPKSLEQRKKQSISGKGRIFSTEHCERISRSKTGKRQSNNKWVYGFNEKTQKGIFISSACEAVKLGFNQGHLRECCVGTRKKHKDYTWVYVNDILL